MRAHSISVGAAYGDRAQTGAATVGFFRLPPETLEWESLSKGLPPRVEVRALAMNPMRLETLIAGTYLSNGQWRRYLVCASST